MARRTPPNGSRGRLRLKRRDWSIAHMMSERTIDTSSMTSSSSSFMMRALRLRRRASSRRMRRGGKPKNEWMVWPPTLIAASPVGATTTISPATSSRRPLRSVDLPVPARPVTNRWPLPSRRNRPAARNSSVGVTPEGQALPAAEPGEDAGWGGRGIADTPDGPLDFAIPFRDSSKLPRGHGALLGRGSDHATTSSPPPCGEGSGVGVQGLGDRVHHPCDIRTPPRTWCA